MLLILNMKKNLPVLLILSLLVVLSCKKEYNEEKIKLNYSSYTLTADETVQLTITEGNSNEIRWSSENEFVASVSENGLVTGLHVGSTVIRAEEGYCEIIVTPKYSYYQEPSTAWGTSIENIISIYGLPNNKIVDNNVASIYYANDNFYSPLTGYFFILNKLEISTVLFPVEQIEKLAEFLNERYQLVYVSDDPDMLAVYVDGFPTAWTTGICVNLASNEEYFWVDYYQLDQEEAKSHTEIATRIRQLRKNLNHSLE